MQRIAAFATLFLGVALLSSCGSQESSAVAPDFAVAGHSGCYTVQFRVLATLASSIEPVTFSGEVTGDIEGAVIIEFDGSSITYAGATNSNSGTATWTITGGVVQAPLAFTTAFENRNLFVDRPGSPATLFENLGRHRAASGVEMASLTYQGTFTLVPAPLADHTYRGVICP